MFDPLPEAQQVNLRVSYRLSPAIDTKLDVDLQVEQLLDQSIITSASSSVLELLEPFSSEPVIGMSYRTFIGMLTGDASEEAMYTLIKHLAVFVEGQYQTTAKRRQWGFNDETHSYRVELAGNVTDGFLREFQVTITDDTTVRGEQDLVFGIAQGLSTESGDQFFPNLVKYLAGILKLDYVLIGSVYDDQQLDALAFYNKGHLDNESILNCDYGPLQQTENAIICYPKEVSKLFPESTWLNQFEIEAYMAVPLYGSDCEYLGVLALMHGAEFDDLDLARSLLTIFSVRASAELELQKKKSEKQRHQHRYNILIENSSNGMFVMDVIPPMAVDSPIHEQVKHLVQFAHYVECNSAFLSAQGLAVDSDAIGKTMGEVDAISDFAGQMREFVCSGYNLKDSMGKVISKNGDECWLSSSVTGQLKEGYLTQIFGVCTDVSERMRHIQQLAHQATHDDLTQLPNRNYFKQGIEQAIVELGGVGRLAIFLLDLDGFKEINDTLGHGTGDQLLQMIGPRMKDVLDDDSALLARLGGDEYGLLVHEPGEESDLIDRALLLMKAIKTPFTVNELDLRVAGSVGISVYPDHGQDFSSLMRCADIAMYQAKELSRDFEIYDSEYDHYSVRRLSLMMDLRKAIEDEQLLLHYQPIVELGEKKVKGFEALVRWLHPKHGMLPPGEFIPLIERTDVIEPLTWWVVETAIKRLQLWQQQGKDYCLSVNVSARNIADDSFVYRLSKLLRQYQVDGSKLEMEITESTLMADPVKGRSVLTAMAAMGIRFAIDDFGTGYSSLAYLKSLPINTLKIDRAFISQMLENPQDEIIVRSTIQLAHNLGMKVTAEGIENLELIEELRQLGCDRGQGFYVCRPVPVEELDTWVELYERTSRLGVKKVSA